MIEALPPYSGGVSQIWQQGSLWGHLLLPLLIVCLLHSIVVCGLRIALLFFQKLLDACEHHCPHLF